MSNFCQQVPKPFLLRRGLCVVGRLGRKKKVSAPGKMGGRKRGSSRFSPLPIVPRALTIFRLLLFLLGYPAVDLLQVDLLASDEVATGPSSRSIWNPTKEFCESLTRQEPMRRRELLNHKFLLAVVYCNVSRWIWGEVQCLKPKC